jgi:hypothetical protein
MKNVAATELANTGNNIVAFYLQNQNLFITFSLESRPIKSAVKLAEIHCPCTRNPQCGSDN